MDALLNPVPLPITGESGRMKQAKSSLEEPEKQPAPLPQLARSLVNRIPVSTDVAALENTDFSPQGIADKIISLVDNSVYYTAGSRMDVQRMMQQARQGVAQGLSEARQQLQQAGQLSESIDQQIQQTESLISAGLNKLEQALAARFPELGSQTSISTAFRQSSEARIEIITRDGDRVAISYSAFTQSSRFQQVSMTDSEVSYLARQQSSAEVNFQFSVEGNIDAEEQQAINDLLNRTGNIASQFFNGDVQAAFESAMQLNLNSTELKSYAMDFQQSRSIQVAQSYVQTEQLIPADSPTDTKAAASPGPVVALVSDLGNLMDAAKQQAPLEQGDHLFKSLLSDLLKLPEQKISSDLQSYIQDLIRAA